MTKTSEKVDKSKHDSLESESTLSFFAKFGYGLGHVYNDFAATVWFSYLLLFFKDVMTMHQEAGPFMVLGQFVDAGFSALVGLLTDRYGTKRSWHILGSIFVTMSFPVIFVLQRGVLPYWGMIVFFSVCIILFQCSWATVQISHLAILPELSKTHRDRAELNSVRYCMSVFANITVFAVTWTVLRLHDQGSDHIEPSYFFKFRNIAIFLTMAGVITTIIFQASLFFGDYKPQRPQKPSTELESAIEPEKVKVSSVLKDPELYKIALLYAFSRLFLVIATIYIPLWLNQFMKTKSNQNVANIALVPLVFYVASLIAAFLLKYINRYVSHKIVYCAGSLISILGCVSITLSDAFDANELYGIASLLGAGSSITQISSLCITSDMIGDKSKHGGLIYSIITVCDKLFSGIIVFVIETLESGQNHYTDVLIFNGATALLGLLVLGTFKRKA